MLVFAVALVFNVPAKLQRAIPDYTGFAAGQGRRSRTRCRRSSTSAAWSTTRTSELSNCTNGATEARKLRHRTGYQGHHRVAEHPGGAPVDLKSLRGKVVLVDFWAYSCINCQRASRTSSAGTTSTGIWGSRSSACTAPSTRSRRIQATSSAAPTISASPIPVALDNDLSTWTNYRNRYWPAEYLIDADGTVRHIKFGEGDYDVTENLIRQLLVDANPVWSCRRRVTPPTRHHAAESDAETYFGVGKMVNYGGTGAYDEGTADFQLSADARRRQLRATGAGGRWTTRAPRRNPTMPTSR